MRKSGKRDDAIAALYGAGMGRIEWGEALAVLCSHVNARGITLDTYDFDASAGTVLASNMAPDPAIVEYNEVYGQTNTLIERTRVELERGRVFRASDFVPVSEFMRSTLYNTVYRKLGIKHVGAIGIECDGASTTQLSVIKPADASDFSDRELARLGSIQAHVRQAWAGYRALARTQRKLDELTSLWNMVEFSVLLVDARGSIRFANRAAEDILRALSQKGAAGAPGSVILLRNQPLACALKQVLAGGGVRYAGALELPMFPGLRATVFGMQSGTAAILITDPLRQQNLPMGALRRRFVLTEAEARVVQRLAAGDSLRQAANHIGIGYETARSQFKSAMTRNGWRRQSAMLSEVFSELLPFGRLGDRPGV